MSASQVIIIHMYLTFCTNTWNAREKFRSLHITSIWCMRWDKKLIPDQIQPLSHDRRYLARKRGGREEPFSPQVVPLPVAMVTSCSTAALDRGARPRLFELSLLTLLTHSLEFAMVNTTKLTIIVG